MKSTYEKLFEGNKKWVSDTLEKDPYFLKNYQKAKNLQSCGLAVATAGYRPMKLPAHYQEKFLYIATLPIWSFILT